MHCIPVIPNKKIIFFDTEKKAYEAPWYFSDLIFIDTVWFDLPTSLIVSKKNGWVQKIEGNLCFIKHVEAPNGHKARLRFSPESQYALNLNKPVNGTLRIEISAPNILYGTNICAVRKRDLPELAEILNGFIAAEAYGKQSIPHINDFKIKRVDFSFCIKCRSQDEADAYMNVFEKYYFKRLVPYTIHGKSYNPDNYPGSMYHSNKSTNCLLYEKTKAYWDLFNIIIDDYTIRFERQLNSINPKEYERENFGNFSSLSTINLLFKKYVETDYFQYDFVPESTYYELVNRQIENENIQRKTKEKLSTLFFDINEDGAYAVHKNSASHFNRCRKITNELSINIVHTELNYPINFLKNICRDNDPDNFISIDTAEFAKLNPQALNPKYFTPAKNLTYKVSVYKTVVSKRNSFHRKI